MRFIQDEEISVFDAFHKRGFEEGAGPGGLQFVEWLVEYLQEAGYEAHIMGSAHLDYIYQVTKNGRVVLEEHGEIIKDRKLRRILKRVERKTFRVGSRLFAEVIE